MAWVLSFILIFLPLTTTVLAWRLGFQTRRVRVSVIDEGRWQHRATRPFSRGRGLRVIRALMAGVRLRRGSAAAPGTSLVLTSPSVPA